MPFGYWREGSECRAIADDDSVVPCRYEKEFDAVQDVFELQVYLPCPILPASWHPVTHWGHERTNGRTNGLIVCATQRNLNNAFAYDLVPSPSVITAALKAARRVNDYPTAVRIFEGTP